MIKKSQKRFKKLMEKAEKLFWKYGYNGVTMDDIANEMGISKATIYNHFPSKDELFIEVLINNTTYHTDRIMEKLSMKNHTVEKVEFLCTYSMELAREFPAILLKDIMERVHLMEKVMVLKRQRGLAMWRYILETGIETGEIRTLDVELVSNLLLHLPGFLMNTDDLIDEHKRMNIYENLFDFIKYGLLGGMESSKNPEGMEGIRDGKKYFNDSREP